MLLRSGCSGGGGGLGSCLFVPEGPAIFITSRIQFPAPASLGLFRGRMRSILTRPLSFLRIRAVITENAPRCDCNPALRAAVYILHFYQCDLQISCIPQEICTSNTEEHILSSFGGRVTFFSFLFFFLTIHKKTQKKYSMKFLIKIDKQATEGGPLAETDTPVPQCLETSLWGSGVGVQSWVVNQNESGGT